MKFHMCDNVSCERCEKHLGWLLEQDAPAMFSIICDDCIAKDAKLELPNEADRKAWKKTLASWGVQA